MSKETMVETCSELGTVILGEIIGKRGHNAKYVAVQCPLCHKHYWARNNPKYSGIERTCHKCSAKINLKRQRYSSHGRWIGGRIKRGDYIFICLPPDSPFLSMAVHGNYVYEHRLIIAQQLNRALLPNEIVHHVNLDKTDNRLENLQLLNNSEHQRIHNRLRKSGHIPEGKE